MAKKGSKLEISQRGLKLFREKVIAELHGEIDDSGLGEERMVISKLKIIARARKAPSYRQIVGACISDSWDLESFDDFMYEKLSKLSPDDKILIKGYAHQRSWDT